MFLKIIHTILLVCVPVNVVIILFCPWSSVDEIPRWLIPSFVITLLQIGTIRAAFNIKEVCGWQGFFPVEQRIMKWWRWSIYLAFFIFIGWCIFLATSSTTEKFNVIILAKAVYLGLNIWYLGFAIMGDGAAISIKARDTEDRFFDKLLNRKSPKGKKPLKSDQTRSGKSIPKN
jgi:hypothetical protein